MSNETAGKKYEQAIELLSTRLFQSGVESEFAFDDVVAAVLTGDQPIEKVETIDLAVNIAEFLSAMTMVAATLVLMRQSDNVASTEATIQYLRKVLVEE